MSDPKDLEQRAMELIKRVGERLDIFKGEFFEAGYKGDIIMLLPILFSDLKPTSFDNLVLEFYRGVEKRLMEEKDSFERAFIFLSTYQGFIPVQPPDIMLNKSKEDELDQFNLMATLMHDRPDILTMHKVDFGVDYNANQALAILNQAGVYVLSELSKRDYREPFNSKIDNTTLIQNFKRYIDRVIGIGRLPWREIPEEPVKILQAAGNPIELLKIVSQNADRFVRRYAALHGYDMKTS